MLISVKTVTNILVLVIIIRFANVKGNLIIKIKNGMVLGTENYTVDLHKVFYAYRGIPYAQPPVGNLRFRTPVPIDNWDGVFDATVDRPKCIQLLGEGVENCLFINVYTPSINSSNLLPVMVWIYGGYFTSGDSYYTSYGPDYFLDEDVIVVNFNYRLGIFGFLSTENAAATGNWALKDQVLALKWVRDNIRYFGGDQNLVTVFGESAGAFSLSYLVQSPLTKNLFQKAIMQSGTSLNIPAFSRYPRSTAFLVGKALGIETDNTTYLVDTLRKVEFRKLQVVSFLVDIGEWFLTNPMNGVVFAPCIEPEHDGAVVSRRSYEVLENGHFNKMPMIIGFNSQEAALFTEIVDSLRLYLLTYLIFPERLIPKDMNTNSLILERRLLALKIKHHYFGVLPTGINTETITQYITDDHFVRPINEAVRLMSKFSPIYYYRFSYEGQLGLSGVHTKRIIPGVGHAEELYYMWRSLANAGNQSNPDLLTRYRLIKLWTNFAKTSNPTPDKDPKLENVTWYPATPEHQAYLDIGKHLNMETDLSAYSITWWRTLYGKYGNPPYDTY